MVQRDPRVEMEGRKVRIKAVNGVTFSVGVGEIFGLLGPNGAGKTTTVKMLCTLMSPDGGSAEIMGFPLGKLDYEIRKRIGVVFGPLMNYHRLTARDNLRFWGKLYRIPNLDARIEELATTFGIRNRIDHLVEGYSMGMKCRLALMRGILHEPELLFLDEPTLGLDPSAALRVREIIKELSREERTTVLLCTHYLAEAEYLCDNVGIISNGRLSAVGSPSDLESRLKKGMQLEILTDEAGMEKIRSSGILHVELDGRVGIPIEKEGQIEAVLSKLLAEGVTVEDIRVKRASLEEVFVHFTSEQS